MRLLGKIVRSLQFNVYIGTNAGRNAVWGNNNTAVGAQALRNGVDVVQTVAMGYGAARENKSGYNSVILGYLAAQKAKIIRNSIIVGAYAGQAYEEFINKLIIGDLIFGSLNDKRLGVNAIEPLADLHICSKDNQGSGRTTLSNGLLVDANGAADIAVSGTTYGNYIFYKGNEVKGGFFYSYSGGNIALKLADTIFWRYTESGQFNPNADEVNTIGTPSKKLKEIYVATPDLSDKSNRVPTTTWVKNLFSSSLSGTGWRITPDGMIEQWGYATMPEGSSTMTISFPIAFTEECFFAIPIDESSVGNVVAMSCTEKTATTATFSGTKNAGFFRYLARGK